MSTITYYSAQPDSITYMLLPDGKADVWLRKNIVETTETMDDETYSVYKADEVYFRTGLTEDEVSAQFEELFENGNEETESELTLEEQVLKNTGDIAYLAMMADIEM